MSVEPRELERALRRFAARKGLALDRAPVREAVALMLEFFVAQRVRRCRLAEDGDMLLFQWGTYKGQQGQGRRFEVDITRQIQFPDDEENEDLEDGEPEYRTMWQLNWTYHYSPDATLTALGSGERWCGKPNELPELERFIAKSKVLKSVASLAPLAVEVHHGAV